MDMAINIGIIAMSITAVLIGISLIILVITVAIRGYD